MRDNAVLNIFLLPQEEGIGSLFSAVPAFILKEIPFNAAKVSG